MVGRRGGCDGWWGEGEGVMGGGEEGRVSKNITYSPQADSRARAVIMVGGVQFIQKTTWNPGGSVSCSVLYSRGASLRRPPARLLVDPPTKISA